MAKMRALVDADYAAELGIECPLVAITGQVKAMVTADLTSYDIPGRAPALRGARVRGRRHDPRLRGGRHQGDQSRPDLAVRRIGG